ncbi:hypothetical protein [Aeoliella mucimassa]|uniref:Uncharacterized protein n=1 Tax=Aeoliella mucimassa TaxID=2527972 RepID=A0A518AR60_9BACT|nr:hypothetical protein [Aeoliella mucimassa]QDU57195.1 hypothetical protein Pan181_34090 [Aeoliella mucimassa]
MKRLVIATALLLATNLLSTGCRSCQSCHDYDSPVANCSCNQCGSGRAGSALSGGYAGEIIYDSAPYVDESYEMEPQEAPAQ